MNYLKSLAKELDNSVVPNNITMREIVEEVNKVRKMRYDKNSI
jgi:hypothetical protein